MLTTNAGPHALTEIEVELHKVWSDNPHVPDTVRMQVGIAVAEIAANIIKHAADGPQVQIHMAVAVLPNHVRVELIDNGRPADVDLGRVQLPDEMAEGGRGLALAMAALEALSYERTTQSRWTLVSKPFG